MFFLLVTNVGQRNNMNFIIDLTHCGISVAQWHSIGAQNANV